ERALPSRASRREAVRAARPERDRRQVDVLDRGERGLHLAYPARSRCGGPVRRAELETAVRGALIAHGGSPGKSRPECPGPPQTMTSRTNSTRPPIRQPCESRARSDEA